MEYSSFETQRPDRRNLIKMALFFTPIAVVSLIFSVVAIANIAAGSAGFWIMLTIFGSLGVLTGSQAILYLRDLTARPIELQGDIVRKWHKANLLFLFFQSYYLMVDSKIYEGTVNRVVEKGAYIRMETGEEAFCPRKELQAETRRKTAADMAHPGQAVEYKIIGIAPGGVYKVSCRKAEERSLVGMVFVISRREYAMLLELDLVKVNFFPHSASVVSLERYDESEKRFVPAASGADDF